MKMAQDWSYFVVAGAFRYVGDTMNWQNLLKISTSDGSIFAKKTTNLTSGADICVDLYQNVGLAISRTNEFYIFNTSDLSI